MPDYCPNVTCYEFKPCALHEVRVVEGGDPEQLRWFAESNIPALFSDAASIWGEWTMSRLESILGDTTVKNVFVSTDGRSTFFKATEQVNRLKRAQMPFSEFVARARRTQMHKPILAETESYYLYGEPMPSTLLPAFQSLPLLSRVCAKDGLPGITSDLLWVAIAGSCSPLHYDLSEGVLAQVLGTKRVIMFPPTTKLYPYPVDHAHDRQSSIPNIKQVDRRAFPLFDEHHALSFELRPGQVLYIPFGWWHQIESEGENVSVSFRWNPFEETARKLALGLKSIERLPVAAKQLIKSQLIQAVQPAHVQRVYASRFATLP